jgi:hypothetical protein
MRKIPAVKFRRKVYAAVPRHKDAIDKAFAGMSWHAKHRIYMRVSEGKENILFGVAEPDGTGFEPDRKFQDARKLMYGFD